MIEPALTRLAARQLGLVRRQQIADLGLSRNQLRNRVHAGALRWMSPSVLGVPGAPASREQRRLLAVFDAGEGAAISHRTAASAWGLVRESGGLHVVRPRTGAVRATHVGVVHEVRDLAIGHVVRIGAIPVTTPARTIMDLAAVESLGRVARVLDRAWGRRLLSLGALACVLREVRVQGRRGVRFVETLLEERLGMTPAESALELRFEEILRRHGLPPMRRQVDVSDEHGWIGRVDYLDDTLGLVAFVDGAAWHTALTDQCHDDAQTARLRAAGYVVVRFGDAEILYDEQLVARRMRRARSGHLAA